MADYICNPFLPIDEYIPDGEPHVFGDRVYLFGSHDSEGGYTYCMEDYVVYSAPTEDLTAWKYEGVSYRAEQDPDYGERKYMYAPDVVRGNDGNYYLYYGLAGDYGQGGYLGPISIAVSNKPQGPYEYLGFVRNPDGSPMNKYVCFDPAVINDDGVIRLYYGTRYGYEEDDDFLTNGRLEDEMEMFGRTREEILAYKDSINGPNVLVLEDDMLTVKEAAKHIIPYKVKGTDFEGHEFFEGSSIRKIDDKYYFIYSSWLNHELCYAISDKPDEGFRYGGTIVSNGDIGLNGRKPEDRLNTTGTTHGSIEKINGQWYVFYHRQTHKSDYSRQACAEKITIKSDGSIDQVEVTSCGLNEGPLPATGNYPAVICANLSDNHMPHVSNCFINDNCPNVTHFEEDRFIGEIGDGTLIGYKYFAFKNAKKISVIARVETANNKFISNSPERIDERSVLPEFKRRIKEKEEKEYSNNSLELRLDPDGASIGRIIISETDD
nr:family 43 glycosylhydrolase [Eubacterium sp.]